MGRTTAESGNSTLENAVPPTRTPFPTYTPTTASATVAPTTATPTLQAATLLLPSPTHLLTTTLDNPTVAPATISDTLILVATPSAADLSTVDTDPQLTVAGAAVNLRSGPAIDYPFLAVAAANQQFPVIGRNAAGDWWQICCVAEQPAWIYGPLVTVENGAAVAVAAEIPPLPTSTPTTLPAPAVAERAPAEVASATPVPATDLVPGQPASHSGTAGNFDPTAQYQIVHYRVLGFVDNNGGIFNKGGQQFIFLTVLDQQGGPVDGAVVKDAVGDKLQVVTGSKGPGKAEIKMDWDPYKLYVASDPSGPTTSQVSNQMNNPHPHLPDVVGLLGPVENEYAVCPTLEDRCEPPFFTVHFSYEITFQRVR